MKEQDHKHLQEEQILLAVIDSNDLAADARKHLQGCKVCSEKVEQFNEDLLEFGEKARQAVPPFTRPVKMIAVTPETGNYSGSWLSFLGAAAMASLVVFFYLMSMNNLTLLANSKINGDAPNHR